MAITIGSAPRTIGSADSKHVESAILFSAPLPRNVFMAPAYGPGTPVGELKVLRRTGVLRGGPRRCGLVLGRVRKAAFRSPGSNRAHDSRTRNALKSVPLRLYRRSAKLWRDDGGG